MSSFISYLISGISLGSVYAIIALGYTMVYGIAKMLNFAHGDVIMVGSYVVYVAVSGMGLNPILAILLSIIICTLMGVVIEGVAYRFASSGAMVTGWFNDEVAWRFYCGSGAMKSSSWEGDYYLLEDGAMAKDQWIGSSYVGSDGRWIPGY